MKKRVHPMVPRKETRPPSAGFVGSEEFRMASVIDVFCGVGGLSYGFELEGFPVCCGIDFNEEYRYAFEKNIHAPFVRRDVCSISGNDLNTEFYLDRIRVVVGCAPCQPFSLYNQKNHNPQWKLLGEFGRLVVESRPEIVSMENVPRLVTFNGGTVFSSFVHTLKSTGYSIWWAPIFCPDYGIPQSRTRLVLLASLLGDIKLEPPSHSPANYATTASAIKYLPHLRAGEIDPNDPLHRSSRLSVDNLLRIKSARPGGTWRDWDPDLVTDCHRRESGKGYSSVYGRMVWDQPSPTITTQFYGFGNGRFGHPEQDRAISLREGAILQSFPNYYDFVAPDKEIHFKKIGRMIGNAVPVLLSRAIARSIKLHILETVKNG